MRKVQFDEESIRARIREVGLREMGLSESAAADVAFHMTDWLADLEDYHRFCSDPGALPDAEVHRLLIRFLVHALNHLAAASKLYTTVPVTDVFGVGATSEDSDDSDETAGAPTPASPPLTIQRLFVYGTLAPGRPNQHILADVPGDWEAATVHGRLVEQGWGAAAGYPALILEPQGSEVRGFLFTSEALAEHWDRLDEFEGPGYERVQASVKREDGTTAEAYTYALSGNSVSRA